MTSLNEPKLSYCELDLEDSNPFFAYDTLAYNDVSSYWIWLQKISSKLSLIETFNLGFDSNPIFSLNHQIEFGCKRLIGLELIKEIVKTVALFDDHCL